jgi:DnaJ-class molecular chaperone
MEKVKVRKNIPTDEFPSKTMVHKLREPDTKICHYCGGYGALSDGHHGQMVECEDCGGTGEELK